MPPEKSGGADAGCNGISPEMQRHPIAANCNPENNPTSLALQVHKLRRPASSILFLSIDYALSRPWHGGLRDDGCNLLLAHV